MLLLFAIQAVLLILAARGAWLLRRHASVSIFFSLALYTTLVAVLTDYGPNRYHVPLIPLLLILGSRGITPHA